MLPENKYLKVYEQMRLVIGAKTTGREAEEIIRQLGQMYNVMGLIIKDFIKLLQPRYSTQEVAVQCDSL